MVLCLSTKFLISSSASPTPRLNCLTSALTGTHFVASTVVIEVRRLSLLAAEKAKGESWAVTPQQPNSAFLRLEHAVACLCLAGGNCFPIARVALASTKQGSVLVELGASTVSTSVAIRDPVPVRLCEARAVLARHCHGQMTFGTPCSPYLVTATGMPCSWALEGSTRPLLPASHFRRDVLATTEPWRHPGGCSCLGPSAYINLTRMSPSGAVSTLISSLSFLCPSLSSGPHPQAFLLFTYYFLTSKTE